MEDDGEEGDSGCDVARGGCLLTNKTLVSLRPAEALAITAVTQSVQRARYKFCLVNLQECLDHCTHCGSHLPSWQLKPGKRKKAVQKDKSLVKGSSLWYSGLLSSLLCCFS